RALLLAVEAIQTEALACDLSHDVQRGALRRLLVSGFQRCHVSLLQATGARSPSPRGAGLMPAGPPGAGPLAPRCRLRASPLPKGGATPSARENPPSRLRRFPVPGR